MVEPEQIRAYCLAKTGAYEDFPFGEYPVCYKLHGRIFAQLYPFAQNYKITLKCDPSRSDFYRTAFPDAVERGYHCPPVQQPHWNTIWLDRLPEEELWPMIDHAYERVFQGFSRQIQEEIQREPEQPEPKGRGKQKM